MELRNLHCISLREVTSLHFFPAWKMVFCLVVSWNHHFGLNRARYCLFWWAACGRADLTVCVEQHPAPQSPGVTIKQMEIKVKGKKKTPFSPVWFSLRLSLKFVYTIIAILSTKLESSVILKYDRSDRLVAGYRDWVFSGLGYTCCQGPELLKKLVPTLCGLHEKVVF